MKHIDSKNLAASRLDCCGRCEFEEDTENTNFGRHVDAHTRCEGAGGLSTGCCGGRDKEFVATRQYKPVPINMETRKDAVSVER